MTTLQIITSKPTASFVTMTKDVVDALLSLNTRNRNKRASTVAHYVRAILAGAWMPTNQGIGVSASGFLIDGQHRLEAMKEAGYPPVSMLVVTGLQDDAMAAVDAGANRNARDYLQFMFDTKVSAHVSAIIRTSLMASEQFTAKKFLPQEYAARLERIGDSISTILGIESVSKLPAAVVSALVDAHHKGYVEETEAFARALAVGEMLERDNPALALRNWIASSQGKNAGHASMVERYKKTTRALQAWVDKRPLSKVYRTKSPLAAAQARSAAAHAVN